MTCHLHNGSVETFQRFVISARPQPELSQRIWGIPGRPRRPRALSGLVNGDLVVVSAPSGKLAHMFDRANGVTKSPDLLAVTSTGLDMLQWRSGTSLYAHSATRKLLELALIDADPIRVGGQWQNRPNRHGLYYWAPTGHHVWHESALEAVCLMSLEFAGEVERIAAQPFRVLFRSGASAVRHDPDFFAVHRNGDQVVYDVKPTTRMTSPARAQFEERVPRWRMCGP